MSWRSMFIDDDSAWPGVQFNPAKGDLDQIQALASDVKSVGDQLDELDHMLKSVGKSDGAWEGEAAQNFAKKLGELPKYLHQGSESMHDCAKALRGWHTHLQGFQDKAGKVEAEAVAARKDVTANREHYDQLKRRYDSLNLATVDPEDPGFKQLLTDVGKATDRVNSSQDKLADLVREAERIHAQWKDRAGEAERAILKASENHPPDLHWWSRAIDGLKAGFRAFTDWLVEHADLLSTISSGLAAAALACEFIPVVGTAAGFVLAGASAVCAAGAMAGHWIGNARGNGTPGWKIALDGLGVLPGVGGIAKSAFAGAKISTRAASIAGAGGLGKVAAGAQGLTRGYKLGEKVYEGVRSPLSQKGVNWLLKSKFPDGMPASVEAGMQLPIKAGSFIHGVEKQLSDKPGEK
ncbi:WXG100 family type VII secretion target [Streptomyces chrestomyceticus]|uniref:WXG100 family type VII secretion target n=1 Tax=Streptomyces chrestomyceticus TaxID=68185 RepID=UPI0036B0E9AA